MALFDQLTIAVGGSHKGYPQAKLEKLIVGNGGVFAKAIEPDVTHLITTQADIEKQSAKVKSAQAAGICLASLSWLLESIEAGKALPEKDYVFSPAPAPTPATSSPSTSQASTATAPRVGTRVSKRTASNLKDMVTGSDADDEKPVTKRTRATAKEKAKDGDDDEDKMDIEEEEKPAPKKSRAAAKGKKVKEEEKTVDAKPAAVKGKAKGKGKAVVKPALKTDAEEDEEEEEEEEEKKEEIKPKMKTVIMKGKAPVDELCPGLNSLHVYVDSAGTVYDATLNQTDIGANNNKFYYCQLLESDHSRSYSVWVRYGRVGERGQTKMYVSCVDISTAMSQFEKLFKSKTGCRWDDRADAHGGPKKYAFLERNYDEDEEEDETEVKAEGSAVTVKSRLARPLQNLMQLIFNLDIMQQSMASMSYDSNKLPLGKLSKEVISRGFQTLKDIGEVIEQKPGFLQKFAEHGNNQATILNRLSNRYYTVIPHSFGRNVPPVIDSGPKLKKEIELIENLGDMALTTKIMAETKATNTDGIHQLDKQFDSLGLNEAVPLDKSSSEFKNLKAYVTKTQGETHHTKLTVEDIFRVTRSGEADRWEADGWHNRADDNRHLLWHGSRSTNFAGILSQGLRIAPPEAPVNGYMFGKGIYLADIVSKSANYCCASSSNNTGLLLLCEAQLGDPMFELNQADYMAAENCKAKGALATKGLGRFVPLEWEDASIVHESLKGVKMPAVTTATANITGSDPELNKKGDYRSLQYNEYIVYNTSQVQIRYLFRCKFGH